MAHTRASVAIKLGVSLRSERLVGAARTSLQPRSRSQWWTVGAAQVEPLGEHEESNSLGFWSSTFQEHVGALYARGFADLVEPLWFPYWEPDKFPRP